VNGNVKFGVNPKSGEVLGEDLAVLEDAMSNLDFDHASPKCQGLLEKFTKSSADS
jgi:hypothetical protein